MDEPPFSLAFVMVKESFAVPAILFYLAATLTKTSIRTTLKYFKTVQIETHSSHFGGNQKWATNRWNIL
jgi:hypothetical protein